MRTERRYGCGASPGNDVGRVPARCGLCPGAGQVRRVESYHSTDGGRGGLLRDFGLPAHRLTGLEYYNAGAVHTLPLNPLDRKGPTPFNPKPLHTAAPLQPLRPYTLSTLNLHPLHPSAPRPSCIDARRSAFGSRVRSGAVALDIPDPEATCGPFFVEAPDHFLYR